MRENLTGAGRERLPWMILLLLLWRAPLLAASFAVDHRRRPDDRHLVSFSPKAAASPLRSAAPVLILQPHVAVRMTGVDSDAEGPQEDDKKSSSLLATLDEAGQSLKPRAARASAKLALAESRSRKFRYLAQASVLYALFILYRAYRGLFVLLPAVFKQVYAKLENAVDAAPFDGTDDEGTGDSSVPSVTARDDVDPATGKVRLRTRITVSALAAIVTAGYVVGGAARVASRFVRDCLRTGNVLASLAAAADEHERNERTMLRKFAVNAKVGGGSDGVNGTNQDGGRSKYSDLAP